MIRKTILITGGSSGLGFSAAESLASENNCEIYITATSLETATGAAEKLKKKTGKEITGLALNLAEPKDIKSFLENLAKKLNGRKLDAVALNAGIQLVSERKQNSLGEELTLAVNHLGHLRMLHGLITHDHIRISPNCRFVFTGSGTHNPKDKIARLFGFRGSSFSSVQHWLDGEYSDIKNPTQRGLNRYANSKLANIMSGFELAKRFPQFVFLSIDPGLMPGTGLARDRSLLDRIAWNTIARWVLPLLPGVSSSKKSGLLLGQLLSSSQWADSSGAYIEFTGRPAQATALAQNPVETERMMNESLKHLELVFH